MLPLPYPAHQVLRCSDLEPSMLQSLHGSALLPATSKASEHVGCSMQGAAPPLRSARSSCIGLPFAWITYGSAEQRPHAVCASLIRPLHITGPARRARPQAHASYGSRPDPAADQRPRSRWQGWTSGTVCCATQTCMTHIACPAPRAALPGAGARATARPRARSAPRAGAPPAQPGARAAEPARSRARST